MILASSLRRASGEPHSSTALNRPVEALFLPRSVSMPSDAPYWRPPTPRRQYGRSTGDLCSRSPFGDSFPVADSWRLGDLKGQSPSCRLSCSPNFLLTLQLKLGN